MNRVTRALEKVAPSSEVGPLLASMPVPSFIGVMRDEFDRLFHRMFGELPLVERPGRGWRWGLDVKEADDAVIVRAEAPGFEPDDFDLKVIGDRLVLRASRKAEAKEEGSTRTTEMECYESLLLPATVDREKVEATYRHGILTVRLPKAAEAKPKPIPVKGE